MQRHDKWTRVFHIKTPMLQSTTIAFLRLETDFNSCFGGKRLAVRHRPAHPPTLCTSEWTLWTWECRLPFWEKDAGQNMQRWGFSPVCFTMWVCSTTFWLKALLQWGHLKGLSPVSGRERDGERDWERWRKRRGRQWKDGSKEQQ